MAHPTLFDLSKRGMQMAKPRGWIAKGAAKHPGLFAEKAKRAGMTTREYAEKEKNAGGTLGKEANFALNAMAAGKRRRSVYNHPRSQAHHKD